MDSSPQDTLALDLSRCIGDFGERQLELLAAVRRVRGGLAPARARVNERYTAPERHPETQERGKVKLLERVGDLEPPRTLSRDYDYFSDLDAQLAALREGPDKSGEVPAS